MHCSYSSVYSTGYHTFHRQVLGVHDDSSATGKTHLAQQHSKDNGKVLVEAKNASIKAAVNDKIVQQKLTKTPAPVSTALLLH